MLQGLDPVLENIVADLDHVTDFRSIDFYNQVWNYKNADRFGTIEGAKYDILPPKPKVVHVPVPVVATHIVDPPLSPDYESTIPDTFYGPDGK